MAEPKISTAFLTFQKEAPQHSAAWGKLIQELSGANTLDPKTTSLVYLGIMAAVGLESGIPFHVHQSLALGATKDEIKSAILIGLPLVGNRVTKGLEAAFEVINQ